MTDKSSSSSPASPEPKPVQYTPEQQALMQLQVQMQQLQMQLANQHVAASAAATAAASAGGSGSTQPHVRRAKIKEPSLYAGDPQKIDGWVMELDQQFLWYQFSSDIDRIALATAHQIGRAHV